MHTRQNLAHHILSLRYLWFLKGRNLLQPFCPCPQMFTPRSGVSWTPLSFQMYGHLSSVTTLKLASYLSVSLSLPLALKWSLVLDLRQICHVRGGLSCMVSVFHVNAPNVKGECCEEI